MSSLTESIRRADEALSSVRVRLERARLQYGEAEYKEYLERSRPAGAEVDEVGDQSDDLDHELEDPGPWAWTAWITQTQVPSPAEQRRLAMMIEAGVLASGMLSGEVFTVCDASDQELEEIVEIGRHAFGEMVVRNARLALTIARRYSRGDPSAAQDYFQDAMLGLIRAVQGWDALRGYTFSTYATWHVQQSIDRRRMLRTGPVHIPIHVQEAWAAAERNGTELTGVAAEARAWIERTVSLESGAAVLADEVDRCADELGDVLDRVWLSEFSEQSLDALSPREASVLKLRFGFLDEPHTLEEVGEALGVTRERARQIEVTALGRTRVYWIREFARRVHSPQVLLALTQEGVHLDQVKMKDARAIEAVVRAHVRSPDMW